MKYIRTKEYGVCKVTNEDKNTLSYENSYVCGCLWKDGYKDKIQYADNLEELCDCYLCFTKSGKNWITTENYETAKLYAERGCKVNACILTDKGLIYVAKMNEKGELELL